MGDTASNIQRLQQLAESRHAIIIGPLAALSKPSAASTTCSAADRSAAIQLLQERSRKSKQSDFDYKEIHTALQDVVKSGGGRGVVVALIEMLLSKRGNVNISREISHNLWKILKGKNRVVQRSDLLQTATTRGYLDIIKALAPHADLQSLNESISISLEKKNLNTTEVLLSYGADAASDACQLAFKGFIREGNHEMINLLLRCSKRPPDQCITESLALATQQGSLDTVKLLVKSGADCRYQNAGALKDAVTLRRDDLAVAMLAGVKRDQLPSNALLDEMIALTSTEQFLLREALLCAGAKGPGVNTLLCNSVEKLPPERDNQLISILVRYGANVNFDNGKCVKSVVSRGELDILRLLMPAKPSVETASQSMTLAMGIEDRAQRTEIIRLLVGAGASGESQVGEVLLAAVQESPVDITMLETLLRQGRADINYDEGEALCYAVEYCELPVLGVILRHSLPSPAVIGRAIGHAIMLSPTHTNREAKIQRLLQKEKTQISIDDALITELQALATIPAGARSFGVLGALLKAKADPNFQTGKSLCLAVEMEDLTILNLILQRPVNSQSLSKCLPIAIGIQLPSLRFAATRKLVAKGIPEDIVSGELISVTRANDLELCKLLTEYGGSVNFENGRPLEVASGATDIKILQHFLGLKPTKPALIASFKALTTEKDRMTRFVKLELLLKAGLEGEAVNVALILTMRMNVPDLEVLSLLVRYGVSVNHRNGEAMAIAISSVNIEALKILLSGTIFPTTFGIAFQEGWALSRQNRRTIITMLFEAGMPITDQVNEALLKAVQDNIIQAADRPMIELLLAKKVSPLYKNAQCLFYASQSLDFETTSLLLTIPEALSVVTEVFKSLMTSSDVWQSESGLRIANLLLSHGVDSEVRNQALVKAVDEYRADASGLSASFLDILLRYRADVSFKSGLALQKAALQGNQEAVMKLLAKHPNVDALSMAFPYILLSNQEDAVVISLIEAFIAQGDCGVQVDVNFQHPNLDHVLFLALEHFPGNISILRRLLVSGCNPDQQKICVIDDHRGEESVTVLCWVLCQEEQRIYRSIVDILIEFKANPNLMTTKSWTTPLLVAAQVGRQDLVTKLLQAGARADVENYLGESPLAFASQCGDINMMASLIGSGIKRNDGSLHDAARELQIDAIKLLIDNGHDLNFPSERHNGRSVLGELCHKSMAARQSSPARERELEITIELLVGAGADFTRKCGSKSVLHLALDSTNPLPITRALLKTIMYNFINDKFNIYTDPDGIVYSPTMYVLKEQSEGFKDQQQQLWKLLDQYGSHNIYYASRVGATQPEGWTNAPPEVTEEEDRKKRREIRLLETREELAIQLENERLTAAQAEAVKKAAHDLDLSHATSFARKQLQLEVEAVSARETAAQRQRQAEISHMEHVTSNEIQREARLGQTRLEIQSREHRLLIDYQSERAVKDQAALNARMGSERSHRAEMNRIDEAAAGRRLEMLKQGTRLLNQAAARAESAPVQRLITYSVEEAD